MAKRKGGRRPLEGGVARLTVTITPADLDGIDALGEVFGTRGRSATVRELVRRAASRARRALAAIAAARA